jgi:hypothetical protein
MNDRELDERQQRIYRRLALVGRGPAAFFLDACRIMRAAEEYAAPTHLVGHAMREIESSVRDVFEPIVGYAAATKKQGKDKHAFEISRILAFIGIQETDTVAKSWLEFAGDKNDRALHRYAHRLNLDVRRVDAAFEQSWDDFLHVMDAVLGQLEDRFFVFIDELDRLLSIDSPSEKDVQRLQEYIVRNVTTERYFFERLSHVGWIEPLREAGVFKAAPPVYWPVSDYLRRMAPGAPDRVAACLAETPTSVSFWTVGDYLDASAAIDATTVAMWVHEWLVPWISAQAQVGWLIPEKLQTLVLRLISAGHGNRAFAVAEAVLSPGGADQNTDRLDKHDFETFLQVTMPVLSSALPDEALRLSLQILLSALRLVGTERAQFDTIWRPSIEHAQDYSEDLLNTALSLVRDTTVDVLTASPGRTPEIVDLLLQTRVPVLRRMAWFLLSRFGKHAVSHVRELLVDTERLRDSFDYGEFGCVLRENAVLLDASERAVVLSTLEAGPDLDAYIENVRRWRQAGPSTEDVRDYVARWRFRFLRQLDAALPDSYRAELSELHERYGTPPEEDHGGISASWGAASPKSTSELTALTTEEIVAFLRAWTPGEGADSREGLGDALREAVKSDPERLSADAAAFMVEDPVYVSDFVGGIDEILESDREIAWEPVLSLCEFVVRHEPVLPKGVRLEATWAWAHQRVAWLIRHAFDRDLLPDVVADAVLRTLARLLTLPELRGPVTPEAKKPIAAVTAAMNTVRGVAMDACVSFAVWRNELADSHRKEDALAVLAEVCDESSAPSTHAALGGRFLSLWVLDREWLAARRARLFPSDDDLWSAAWAGYIFRSRAYPDVFDALLPEYERAVATLDPADSSEHDELSRRLAQHLAMLYLSGSLPLDAKLLRHFFDRAAGDVRGAFHWSCLRAVADNPDKVSVDHWMRLRSLWDMRLAAPTRTDSQKELHWFGWLLGLLPDSTEWALRQLLDVVRRGIDTGHDRDVLERLAASARAYPADAFACVRALADADTDGRDIRGWDHKVEQVLVAARDAGDPALKGEVELFINRLAARGVLSFRHLLAAI